MTGDICVELLTAPSTPSGSGDIDHELAAVFGPLRVDEEVVADTGSAAEESAAGAGAA